VGGIQPLLEVESAALISRSMASKVDEQMCKTVLESVVFKVFIAGSHSDEMPGMLDERPLNVAATSSHTGSGSDGGCGNGGGGEGESVCAELHLGTSIPLLEHVNAQMSPIVSSSVNPAGGAHECV